MILINHHHHNHHHKTCLSLSSSNLQHQGPSKLGHLAALTQASHKDKCHQAGRCLSAPGGQGMGQVLGISVDPHFFRFLVHKTSETIHFGELIILNHNHSPWGPWCWWWWMHISRFRKASQQAKSQSFGRWDWFLEWAPPRIKIRVGSREDERWKRKKFKEVEVQRRLIGGGRNDAHHWSTTARLRQRAMHPRPSPRLD